MSKADRIINIIDSLARDPAASAAELAAKLRVSERSVYRYLSDLKRLGYSLHSARDENGLNRHALQPLSFTAQEALALVAACQSLLSQKGLPLCDHLSEALAKIKTAVCGLEERRQFLRLESRFTFINRKTRDYTPWAGQIDTICDCIRHGRTIKVIYNSRSSGQSMERLLDPYDLFWSEGDLYLAAYCHNNKEVRSFKANRFTSVKKTPGHFTRQTDFDLQGYLGCSWRVWRGTEALEVKILAQPPASLLFIETSYHESQQVTRQPDGSVLVSVKTVDTPELRSWLLSWGSQVEVLEPQSLRVEIKRELLSTLESYSH
jgi:predicted DNA-binding transcriptional regulator YafY